MDELTPTARWTITQPWRGIFGLVVTLGTMMIITSIFDMQSYMGIFTTFILLNVPIVAVIGAGWEGKYPSTDNLTQPARGIILTVLVVCMGILCAIGLVNFSAGGAATPFIHIRAINTVITSFFLIIAFGMWPFHKLSLPAKGFLTLILAYVIGWLITLFFNFSLLSYPQGINPSPIAAVPFYAEGGPLAPFASIAPMGPFAWESALVYYFCVFVFLWCFVILQFWPFSKSPALMKQPVMGIVVVISCLILGTILYFIGISALSLEPLRFMIYLISFLFGLLMFLFMFQTWPGRVIKNAVGGGLLNIILAIIIGIIAYNLLMAFCTANFGSEAMAYPNDIFALGNLMLGLVFPAWAVYAVMWDFWPLPPTPQPPPDAE